VTRGEVVVLVLSVGELRVHLRRPGDITAASCNVFLVTLLTSMHEAVDICLAASRRPQIGAVIRVRTRLVEVDSRPAPYADLFETVPVQLGRPPHGREGEGSRR
jgi:hypothetical protein